MSSIVYDSVDQSALLDANTELVIPVKKSTPKKQIGDSDKKKIDGPKEVLPPLNFGDYLPVGPTFPTSLKNIIKGVPKLRDIQKRALLSAVEHNVVLPEPILPRLNKIKISQIDPDDPSKTILVSKASLYRSTETGKKLLELYAKHDGKVRSKTDSFVKAYIKSNEGKSYYQEWLEHKNPDFMSDDIFYIITTISKYMAAKILGVCVETRSAEIQRDYDTNPSKREYNSIPISTDTLRNFITNYFATPVKGLTLLYPHIFMRLLMHLQNKKYQETKKSDATDAATPDPTTDADDDSESMLNIISEVFKIKIASYSKILPDQKTLKVTTTAKFKTIIADVMMEFCTKTVENICETKRAINNIPDGKAVVVRVEDLTAYLSNLANDGSKIGDEQRNIDSIEDIIEKIRSDYNVLNDYRKTKNLSISAHRAGISIDQLEEDRAQKQKEQAEKEFAKEAAALGKTIDQYKAYLEERKHTRENRKAEAAKKRDAAAAKKMEANKSKFDANSKRWRELVDKLKSDPEINISVSEPPSI